MYKNDVRGKINLRYNMRKIIILEEFNLFWLVS